MHMASSPHHVRVRLAALAAAMLLAAGLTACTGQATPAVSIWVSEPSALFDQPIQVKVTGLAAGQRVTVAASAKDANGQTWESAAAFAASQDGVVDLATASPAAGSYRGADAMGLFWSMATLPGDPSDEFFNPPLPQQQAGVPIQLTVTSAAGRRLAARTVTRMFMVPGETAKTLTKSADGITGVLFLPPPGTPRHAGVLAFGGAEGGMSQVWTAALLAAHGYPALTIAYFNWPGLPTILDSIPLEYFKAAGQLLAGQSGTNPERILTLGYSRGSEAALLAADNFPRLFHGAIVYAPSADVNPSQIDATRPGWTLDGRGIYPGAIPLAKISGPVLVIAGAADSIWNSSVSALRINLALGSEGSRYPHQALIYPDAGHGVGTYPYEPIGSQILYGHGGSRAGDDAAQRSSWAKVLALLAAWSAR
jgi:dienelactone hydrolase